jgi:transketolase
MKNFDNTETLDIWQVYGKTLVQLGQMNKDVVVIEADLMRTAGTERFAKNFPHRSFQVGIAEQNLIGAAAGLATVGKIPFVNTFSSFASRRACDQIAISVAFANLNVKIAGIYAGFTTEYLGPTHHSLNDIAIMRSLPNMAIISPADPYELKKAVIFAAKHEGPIYLRIPFGFLPCIYPKNYRFAFGKGVVLKGGYDVTLVSTGIMVSRALKAAAILKNKDIDARVVSISTLKPIDRNIIIKACQESNLIITIEDHNIIGGLGSIVAEIIAEEKLNCKLIRMGIKESFGDTGSFEWLIKKYKIDTSSIVRTVERFYDQTH